MFFRKVALQIGLYFLLLIYFSTFVDTTEKSTENEIGKWTFKKGK